MDRNRLVEVHGDGQRGTGYVLGARLVLTSAHGVGRMGEEVELNQPGGDFRYAGVVVWCGEPGGPGDAALVRIDDEQWQPPRSPDVRWGSLVTTLPGQRAETWGVPQVAQKRDQSTASRHKPAATPKPPKEFRQLTGTVNPGSGIVAGKHLLDLAQFPPEWRETGMPWGGLSGAPLFCGDLLTGVIFSESARSQHSSLEVVPTRLLLDRADFRAALAEHEVGALSAPVEFQALAERAEPESAAVLSSPAALLQADRQIVGFHGRDELMARLTDWCTRGGAGVWLLHGPGGQGKTRLAHHLAAALTAREAASAHDDWVVLWPRDTVTPGRLSTVRHAAQPVLVVLDYAETRGAQLSALLSAAVEHGGGTPFKLLLLARSTGEWWNALRLAPEADEPVKALLEDARAVALPALEADPVERPKAYRAAVEAFAAAMPRVRGQQAPDWPALVRELPVPALAGPGLGNALTLHMTALADLLDAAVKASGPATGELLFADDGAPRPMDAEDRLLEHELAYWHRAALAADLFPGLARETLADAMVAAIVLGTEERASGDDLLRRVPALADQSYDRRRRVRRWIEALYPAAGSGPWGTLQPDRLAERFIGGRLHAGPELAHALLRGGPEDGRDPQPDVSPDQAARLLTLLVRAAAHPPLRGRLDGLLAALCADFLPVLGGPAIEVAAQAEEPEPLIRALRALTADPATPSAALVSLADHLPATSHNLAPWAVELAERLVTDHLAPGGEPDSPPARSKRPRRPAARSGVPSRRASTAGGGTARSARLRRLSERAAADTLAIEDVPDRTVTLAARLRQLSVRLVRLGRHEEGAQKAREAITLLRPLVRTDTKRALPELAACLNDLAVCLRAIGAWQEALAPAAEAVEVYRELERSEQAADRTRTRTDLASSLDTLAVVHGELGQAEAALAPMEEAVRLVSELVEQGHEGLRPHQVSNLNNLAHRYLDLGRREDALAAARKAVATCEPLAEASPDAHLENLAMTLGTLSSCLGDMGLPDAGLEAVKRSVAIRRRLAKARPEAYEPGLAMSLNALAVDLGEYGQYPEAAEAIGESVALYRKLERAQPSAFRHLLAMSLNSLANHLSDVADHDGALAAAREAADLYAELALGLPETFGADVAMSLLTLAGRLHDCGEHQAAVEAAEQAVARYRKLAEARAEAVNPSLATSLNNLGRHLRAVGRAEEALAVITEALRLIEAPAGEQPRAFGPALSLYSLHHAQCLRDLGRLTDAVQAMRRAVDIDEQLAELNPALYEEPLALKLTALSAVLNMAGQGGEAVEVARRTVDLRRRMAEADPHAADGLLAALEFLVQLLHLARRLTEAEDVLREVLKVRRRALAHADSPADRVALVTALGTLGGVLLQTGRRAEALAAVEEAAGLRQRLSEQDRAVHEPALASAVLSLGFLLFCAGRGEEALEAAGETVDTVARLAAADPGRLPLLAVAHTTFGVVLSEMAEPDRALAELERAVEIARPLAAATADVAPLRQILASALNVLGEHLALELGRHTEALAVTAEAVAIHRWLADTDPIAYRADLLTSAPNHGMRLAEVGRHEEALSVTERALTTCRRSAEADPTARELDLAYALHAYARARLLADVQRAEAVEAVSEALTIVRRVAEQEPALVGRALRLCLETRAGLLPDPENG